MEIARESKFSWIESSLKPMQREFDPARGVSVAHCIPDRFSSYLKIFHPMYIDPLINDRKLTWDEAWRRGESVRNAYRVATAEMTDISQATLVKSPAFSSEVGTRIRWGELASKYGLIFHAEFNESSFRCAFPKSWPRYIYGAAEGFLEFEQLNALLGILRGFTTPQLGYIKLSDMWRTGDKVERLFRGDVADISSFLQAYSPQQSAEYIWPEDKSWCVNGDYDFDFTLVGGSKELIQAISDHSLLETTAVSAKTRVDYLADRLNMIDKAMPRS